jgi:phenylalanyl-tRNA synthetase alpha subunit
MSKITSLLFVLLVGTICSMTTKSRLSPFEQNLLPQHSIMRRLNNIFVELKGIEDSSSNVKTFGAFTQVIKGLIDDLQSDEQKHQKVLEEMTAKCTDEDKFRSTEVADAEKSIRNAVASRDTCQQHLNKATELLEEAKKLLEAEVQKKKERTEIRKSEHDIYVKTKQEYDQAINFLNEFIKMVGERFGGKAAIPSFIEMSENLLRHSSKIGKVEAAVPVLIMMTKYVSAAAGDYQSWNGSDASKTLVEKLRGLLATIESDLEKITQLENQRQADFNAFLIKVNKNIDDLNANIVRLTEQIRTNKECVARENAIITEATNKLTRNKDLKEKALRMCEKFVKEVEQAQKARRTEIEVVREILNLMKIRFGKVPKSMVDYLDSVENGFAVYENKTKLIAYQIYKYLALNENALGKDIVSNKVDYVENKKF